MLNRKGQNFAEYAIVIAIVIGAALAMQTFVKRGLQGKVAAEVNKLGGGQYEPNYSSEGQVTVDNSRSEQMQARGGLNITGINETTTKFGESGWEEIGGTGSSGGGSSGGGSPIAPGGGSLDGGITE